MVQIKRNNETEQYQPSLIFDAKPDRKYKVRLKEHDITPNPATKSYKVVFSMPTPKDLNVLSGMTGKLVAEMNKVLQNTDFSLLVPVEAVFVPNDKADSGLQFVYRLTSQNKTELVKVTVNKIGQKGAYIQPVEQGRLSVGDTVIAAGSHLLNEGQEVRPWQQERGL